MPIFAAFERMVALRTLRARRKEGFLSVIAGFSLLGIVLGVATLIVVMAVMNGFRAELLGRMLGLNGHLVVQGNAGPMTDPSAIAARAATAAGVTLAVPAVEGQAMASGPGAAGGVMIRAMAPADFARRPALAGALTAGRLEDFQGDGIIIGARMAEKYRVGVGQSLTLISPKGNITAFGTVPRMRPYRVVGLLDVGLYEFDSAVVFMPLEAAQTFLQLPGKATHIEVMTTSVLHLDRVAAPLERALGPDFMVYDWARSNAGFLEALAVERNVMFLILTMIVLVAAVNIVSGLTMLVRDKGRDIAILRTMGASRGAVLRIFFLSGAAVGLAGTGGGVGLGLLVCAYLEPIRQAVQALTGVEVFSAEIYYLTRLPVLVETGDVLAVAAMSLGLSFLATLYPAWRAARLDPVEALRYA